MSGDFSDKLERFRALVEAQQQQVHRSRYGTEPPSVTVKHGNRWVRVDIGTSGRFLVDTVDGTAGQIVGIKAYGVPHYGHRYGTLDTIEEFFWGEYGPARLGK